jgi:HSP20 family protein
MRNRKEYKTQIKKEVSMSLITLNDLPTFLDRTIGRDSADLFGWNSYVGSTVPAVNIVETNDNFEIEVATPGYGKNDFKVELQQNMLRIAGNKALKDESNQVRYTKREFDYGNWERVFTLPNTVQTDNIEAHYENGILSLVVPKKEEAKVKPPKAIEIK